MIEDAEVDSSAGPPLAMHLAPLAVCLAAGLILALAPFAVWQAVTGRFVCTDTPDVRYGLQIAAQPYYGHSWYLTDPAVAGGVTYYSWLQYGLAAFAARAFGLSIFSISVMWKVWTGLGLAASLYLVFWLLLGARWIAAGCAIYLLSDSGTCCYFSHPVIDHLRRVASALIKHRHSVLNLAPEPLWQLGVPHPGVVLPFAFFQIAAIVRARGRGGRWIYLLPGLIFALTFYLYFYLWTTIAIGLAIAAGFDREGCRLYLRTLCLGALLGLPQVVRDSTMSAHVSADALHRFGLMVRATSMDA